MEGQVAIVTGGAMGIGREYVEVLLSRKVKVCLSDINVTKGQEAVAQLQETHKDCDVIFQLCDVTKNEQLEDVFKKTISTFGRLDIVINNAGIMLEGDPDMVLAVNLGGTLSGTRIALKYMSTASGGHGGLIVNIGSIFGLMSAAFCPTYVATKHAVLGYSRSIGLTSLTDHGVRINCICPAYTETPGLTDVQENGVYGPEGTFENLKELLKTITLLSPKTVAACLVHFLDDVTLSGAAILCTMEHNQAMLKLPASVDDIHSFYVRKE